MSTPKVQQVIEALDAQLEDTPFAVSFDSTGGGCYAICISDVRRNDDPAKYGGLVMVTDMEALSVRNLDDDSELFGVWWVGRYGTEHGDYMEDSADSVGISVVTEHAPGCTADPYDPDADQCDRRDFEDVLAELVDVVLRRVALMANDVPELAQRSPFDVLEALCDRCGEPFVPTDYDDLLHLQDASGNDCHGMASAVIAWTRGVAR